MFLMLLTCVLQEGEVVINQAPPQPTQKRIYVVWQTHTYTYMYIYEAQVMVEVAGSLLSNSVVRLFVFLSIVVWRKTLFTRNCDSE